MSEDELAENDDENAFAATTLSIDDEKCSLYLFVDGDIPEGSLAAE